MTETTPAVETPAAEPRLAFRHWPSFSKEFLVEVAVTERLSKKRSVTFSYAVREVAPLPSGARVFQFFKQGEPLPRELRVYPSGHTCTCKSGTYRSGGECRHKEAFDWLRNKGVIS